MVDILVVDDDADTRAAFRTRVEDAGYFVYECPDGASAFQHPRTHPDSLVVVLDWLMPGLDGLEVMRAVAQDVPLARRHAYFFITAATIG